VKVTPAGSGPDSVIVGEGFPVAVTMNVLEVNVGNEATFAELIPGEFDTLMVMFPLTLPAVLEAVTGTTNEPAAVGVPVNDAVVFPLSVKVTPGGRALGGAERAGMGSPAPWTR